MQCTTCKRELYVGPPREGTLPPYREHKLRSDYCDDCGVAEYTRLITPFLKELGELSTKHGLYIGGCGCCHSPCIKVTDKPTTYTMAKNSYLEAE